MSELGLNDEWNYKKLAEPQAVSVTAQPLPGSPLVTCPDCGNLLSSRAETCPRCGLPFRTVRDPPGIARIAAGVIVGYFGILIVTFVLAVAVSLVFGGILAGIVNSAQPTTSQPRSMR